MALEGEDEAPAALQSSLNEAGLLDPDPNPVTLASVLTESELGIWARSETSFRLALRERELKKKETFLSEIGLEQWVSA